MTIEEIYEALETAESVMDYCAGDAWERECTKEDRDKFAELKEKFEKENKLGDYSPEAIKAQKEKNKRDEDNRFVSHIHNTNASCSMCNKVIRLVGAEAHLLDKHGVTRGSGKLEKRIDKLIKDGTVIELPRI